MTIHRSNLGTADQRNLIPIGFQLYAVRGEFAKDVPGTLRRLSQIGYQGVEFWGYSGTPTVYQSYSAIELRKLLEAASLECCGIHVELNALSDDNLSRTIENNRSLGSEYLNVAAAEEHMRSEQGIAKLIDRLNQAAEKCQPHGMKIGYHAHPFDFVRINGRSAWEILFTGLRPEINMQMDVGNCLAGNGDPIAMLKQFPKRTLTIHIKEHDDKTFASPLYSEVFRLCETTSNTKWYIVEMGGTDGMGFEIPQEALVKLHRLGK